MFRQSKLFLLLLFLIHANKAIGQDIELFEQFNGRFDYIAIGNTMNLEENESSNNANCNILTSSSANLNLNPGQNIAAAYLYWAGSGEVDTNVNLNGITVEATKTFNTSSTIATETFLFFAAFADVTSILQTQGNTMYTVSDLILPTPLTLYCQFGVNFAGWSIVIIYEDDSSPLNQLNVYDGLQRVPVNISITLDSLNIIDNEGAKIGFLAWEGDSSLAVNEQLTINGNVLENLPLNPANNAFNGTNSFTGQTDLFNMDIDVYDIENNINIGDTSAIIELTSNVDIVLVNNIVTVLNSQLPDATLSIDNVLNICASNILTVDFTIYNNNSTAELPAQTPVSFYIDNQLIGTTETLNTIPINGSETNTIVLTIPETLIGELNLIAVVDDDGSGNSSVTEINENNNTDTLIVFIEEQPIASEIENLLACDVGFNSAEFNLTQNLDNISFTDINLVSYYSSIEDVLLQTNEIINPESYNTSFSPQTIYMRVENDDCFDLYTFQLIVENCPPIIPEGFSPNNDGKNDWFNIQGLYNIFENHKLLIYNRYGSLIFEGDNNNKWYGFANKGLPTQNKLVPTGTYYYVLYLNDSNYKTQTGWVYLNR